jgi:hypothetical protein
LDNEVIEGEELKALAVAVSKDDNPDVLRKEHALAA